MPKENEGPNIFIAFLGRNKNTYWTDWFNPPEFRHCFAFWFDGDAGHWILADSHYWGIEFKTLTPDGFIRWLEIMRRAKAKILVTERKKSPSFFFRMGLWCVPFTAHCIGSKSRAWRPIGLWCDLLKEGAKPAFFTKETFNNENTKGTKRKS